jgi:hypothetical protein
MTMMKDEKRWQKREQREREKGNSKVEIAKDRMQFLIDRKR